MPKSREPALALWCLAKVTDYTAFGHPGIDLTAWTEDLMDTDRRPKGAAANSSSVSAYAQTRCYRSHPKGVYPVPHRLRVF